MNRIFALFLLAFIVACSSDSENTPFEPSSETLLKGVDISFLPEIEASNYQYYNSNNQAEDALSIFDNNGVNVVRIRLWKNPSDIHSSFEEVKAFSERVKNKGLKVWLTVHYSDSWADPGLQNKPAEWEGITYEALKDSVYQYTKKIVSEIQPEYIQIGNEINPGFLFPEGNKSSNPEQFKELLSEGLQAVNDFSPTTKTMIHYAGYQGAFGFYNELDDLDYDIIALSYYPNWHGKNMNELKNMMISLKANMNKDVLIAETAYPFTLDWNDWTNNIIGLESQLISEYPATIEGQKNFLNALKQICIETESLGFCYWAPEWVSYNGNQATNGSNWENQALFDFNGRVLESISAFEN